jgi:hypothetical protein
MTGCGMISARVPFVTDEISQSQYASQNPLGVTVNFGSNTIHVMESGTA